MSVHAASWISGAAEQIRPIVNFITKAFCHYNKPKSTVKNGKEKCFISFLV